MKNYWAYAFVGLTLLFSAVSIRAQSIDDPPKGLDDLPTPKVAKSLENGQNLDVKVWIKAVDAEIHSLDELADREQIDELNVFKNVLVKQEHNDPSGNHDDVKDALQLLRNRHPVIRRHILSYVNQNG